MVVAVLSVATFLGSTYWEIRKGNGVPRAMLAAAAFTAMLFSVSWIM